MIFDPALTGFGALVGLSLGLTGSGGSILAIPLLVYGAHMKVEQALAVSLLMVASIAAFGAARQSFSKQVNWRAAILFSIAGVIVSPLVVALCQNVDEHLRMGLFAVLMLIVAWRMATRKAKSGNGNGEHLEPHSASLLHIAAGGALAGALAGFFGVGGGFIIVPLLTLIFAMPYKQAVGTSLASIAMISVSALAGHFIKGVELDLGVLANFIGGGALGLLAGIMTMNRIPEIAASRVFAGITAAMAVFMLIDKFLLHQGGTL